MRLSVIIINYNVRYFLEQCLYSVQKALKGIDAEILVIDNASTDGSRAYLEPKFPAVNFDWGKENLGFARANNYGLSIAKGELILFLNPDTLVPEDVFSLSLAYFGSHPDVGAMGIRMLDGSGKFLKESKRAFPSPVTAFFKLTGLASLFPKSPVFAKYHLGHLDEMKTQEADVLSGAFMMVRKKILKNNGGFDESFFMYGEDIDLSYRIKQAGHVNIYFAETSIIHFKGESTKKGSLKYVKMFYSAMAIFVRKHYGGAKASIFLIFIHLAIWLRAVLSVAHNIMKPLRLTLVDTSLIFCSFALTIYGLDQFASAAMGYPPLFSLRAPLFYSFTWFVVSRFTKLYSISFIRAKLFANLLATAAISLIAASWLTDELSISHISVIAASAIILILTLLYRWLMNRMGYLRYKVDVEEGNTIVAGSDECFVKIQRWFKKRNKLDLLKGRVATAGDAKNSICTFDQLNDYTGREKIHSIIFCENGLSFKQIIDTIDKLKTKLFIRIIAAGSTSIVGSDSKDEMGETTGI